MNPNYTTGATGGNYMSGIYSNSVYQGITGSMINSLHQQKMAGENVLMYTDADKNKVLQRFYSTLNQFFANEEESKIRIQLSFDVAHLSKQNTEESETGEYYKLTIGLFYFLDDKRDTIWFRDENIILSIQRDSSGLEGSIYFSPFSEDKGMIYLGKTKIVSRTYSPNAQLSTSVTESIFYCFLVENTKSIFYATQYQFSRLQMILQSGSGLLIPLTYKTKEIYYPEGLPFFGDLILSGKLSDHEIKCTNGVVKISRAFLSYHSDYFMYLFSNSVFGNQDGYVLEFETLQIENYTYYLSNQTDKIKLVESASEDIMFASFIQDKSYMHYIYHKLAQLKDEMDVKDQLRIITLYQSFGFQFA